MKVTQNTMKIIVGASVIALMLVCVLAVIFVPAVAENKMMIHLLGIIEGALLTVVNYYFGSSKGSSDKNKMLKDENTDN